LIFRTATTSTGQRLEYRASKLATVTKFVHRWMHLPRFVRNWVGRRAIQRRIDGGPWQTVQVPQ
jgi:hypothetical protein